MEIKYTFKKEERITKKKDIKLLFNDGQSFVVYPLYIVFIQKYPLVNNEACSVLINVSKKRFKHATDRNRIKRWMREAYRLNKKELVQSLEGKDFQLLVGFVYTGKKLYNYSFVELAMRQVLVELREKLT